MQKARCVLRFPIAKSRRQYWVDIMVHDRYKARSRGPETMKNQKLVSVVIPTFNRAATLSETIESVLHQTHADFEIVIADDGSIDGTEALIRGQYSGNDRIRYYRQGHTGAAAARNLGLGQARGEYIAFLDSDDLWHKKKLEWQLQALDAVPDAGLVWSDFDVIDGQGEKTHERHLRSMYRGYRYFPVLDELFEGDLSIQAGHRVYWSDRFFSAISLGNLIHGSTVIFTRARREQIGYLSHLKNGEDHDYFMRAAKAGRVAFLDAVTMDYRMGQDDAISANTKHYAMAEALIFLLERTHREEGKDIKISKAIVQDCFAGAYAWAGRERLKRGESRLARAHFKKSLRHKPSLSSLKYWAAAHLSPTARKLALSLLGR